MNTADMHLMLYRHRPVWRWCDGLIMCDVCGRSITQQTLNFGEEVKNRGRV